MRYQDAILERFELFVEVHLKPELEGVEWKLDTQRTMFGEMAYRIRASILSSRPEVHTVTHPETWWDAFKERWFPAWARERWPVRYQEHRLETRMLFPEMPAADVMADRYRVRIWQGFNERAWTEGVL